MIKKGYLNKKTLNKILIAFIFITILFYCCSFVFASSGSAGLSLDEIWSSSLEFIKGGQSGTIESEKIGASFAEQIKPIITTLLIIGWSVAVGASMILGVKYATAGADSKKRAEVKNSLVGFVIAVFILTMAIPIWIKTVEFVSKLIQ